MTNATIETQSAFDAAEARVHGNDALYEYRDLLLDDHGMGDEHFEWVANADESEIISWCEHFESE